MIQFDVVVDDSRYQAPDFYFEEDTWVSPRRRSKADDSIILFCCFMSVIESRLQGMIEQLQHHRIEGDRIREIAAKLDDANRQLEELVVTDHLTGIGNRRLFVDRLALKLAEAERGIPLTVFLIDVDDFKSFNDNFGHQAGDDALREVASALGSIVRRVDCFARYGGEEFALASTVTEDGARIMADKLLDAVRGITLKYRSITVSIGVTGFRAGDTMHSIVSRADIALYDAKKNGKDRAVVFEDIGREVAM